VILVENSKGVFSDFGGSMNDVDYTLYETAMRETREESCNLF